MEKWTKNSAESGSLHKHEKAQQYSICWSSFVKFMSWNRFTAANETNPAVGPPVDFSQP